MERWTAGSRQSIRQPAKVLYQFHTPSGIIGNPITYMHNGKQYVAVLSGVGGWAAIGLAEGLTKGTEGLGAVGLTSSLSDFTNLGGNAVRVHASELKRRVRKDPPISVELRE